MAETWERISGRAVSQSPEQGAAVVEAAKAAGLQPEGYRGIIPTDDDGVALYFAEPGSRRPAWRVSVTGCERIAQ